MCQSEICWECLYDLLAFLVHGENWPKVISFYLYYKVMNKLVLLSTLRLLSIFCCNADGFSEWKWTGKMPSKRFLHWQVKHFPRWIKKPLIEIKNSNCIVSGRLQAFVHILNSHNYTIGKQSRFRHHFTDEGKEDREIMTHPRSYNDVTKPQVTSRSSSSCKLCCSLSPNLGPILCIFLFFMV